MATIVCKKQGFCFKLKFLKDSQSFGPQIEPQPTKSIIINYLHLNLKKLEVGRWGMVMKLGIPPQLYPTNRNMVATGWVRIFFSCWVPYHVYHIGQAAIPNTKIKKNICIEREQEGKDLYIPRYKTTDHWIYKSDFQFWAVLGSQGCRKKNPNCHRYATFDFFDFFFSCSKK